MKRSLLCLFALTGVLAACDESPTAPDCELPDFPLASVTGDTVTTQTGLRYLNVQAGTGATADPGERVSLRYAGQLTNGTLFDRGGFEFTFGVDRLVPGFEEGIRGMRECEVRRLIIPAGLGYANDPPPGSGIPAGATLIFDVQIVDAR